MRLKYENMQYANMKYNINPCYLNKQILRLFKDIITFSDIKYNMSPTRAWVK